MPPVSKAQARMFQAVCHGKMQPPKGMTRAQACEFVKGVSFKDLPDHVAKAKKR